MEALQFTGSLNSSTASFEPGRTALFKWARSNEEPGIALVG